MEVGDNVWVSDGEVEVMMFTDEEFEGDTVITLPGGGVVTSRPTATRLMWR